MPWELLGMLGSLILVLVLGRRGPTRATWKATIAVASALPAGILLGYLLLMLIGIFDVTRRVFW